MKFGPKKSRGGSQEQANRRSRESVGGYFDKKKALERAETMKKLRAAAKLAKRQVREQCKYKRDMARLRAVEGRREVLMDVRDVLQQELAEIDTECTQRMAEQTGPILQSIQELATEIQAAVAARRTARERAAQRPKASAAERRSEEYDRARRDIEAHDRRLLPVFERVKTQLRPTDRQTLTEAFLELAAETPELLEQEQARTETTIGQLDLGCAEAIHEAQLGNEAAREWAAANCGSQRRPKGSAASRTLKLFGPDIAPPEPNKASKSAKPTKEKKSRQQTISSGPLGGSILDDPPF